MQKFEQIRARWETAQLSDKPSRMAGRKEKQVAHQPLNTDPNNGGGNKFRRKLSHGLSFISNPLSQRRTTPGRQPFGRQSLAASGPSIAINTNASTGPGELDRLLSPVRGSASFEDSYGSPVKRTTPRNDARLDRNNDPDATPRPLPRSRTMSFIPRPSRSGSASSVLEPQSTSKPRTPATTLDPQACVAPSKIPTPSPPATGRRRSSPRQYMPQHTTQQAKHIAASMAFAGAEAASPSKASVRSYTTPNLVKGVGSPQPSSFMVPRKLGLQQKPSGSPSIPRPAMKENTPTNKRGSRRMSQIQEKSSRRESLVAPTIASTRRSFGPSKQAVHTTPPIVGKRLSGHISTQTPLTVKRLQQNRSSALQSSSSNRTSNGSSIAHARLMGPVNPPTPPVVDHTAARPALPRASTDRNLRRRTLTTPSGRNGSGMSSRSVVGTNDEVRVPRSSTFHHFWRARDIPPPVPPIPERYRSPFQPLPLKNGPVGSHVPKQHPSLPLIQEQKPSECHPEKSGSEVDISRPKSPLFVEITLKEETSDDVTALPLVPPGGKRPWPVTDQYIDSADVGSEPQVQDYMPPIWWAGRFQSRFDQWRSEAMTAELDPRYKSKTQLGQITLSQDKIAACYILLQLRDLCVSNQAADSLWEFEYKYRQDHKLLGTAINLPPFPKRKLEDIATPRQGPISRAVRKLTPRKSSLVNLLKGKGWNKVEEAKHNYGSSEHDTLSGRSHGASSGTS